MQPYSLLGLVLTTGLWVVLASEVPSGDGTSKSLGHETSDVEMVSVSDDELEANSALLRNIFSVNLKPNNRRQQQHHQPKKRPKIKVATSGTQKKRLDGLFQALSNPIRCEFKKISFCFLLKFFNACSYILNYKVFLK